MTICPVHVGLETGGPQIHDEAPENIAYDYEKGDGAAVAAVMATAAHRVTVPVMDNRVLIVPMEPRGAFAEWGADGRVHLCFGGQGVWGMKDDLADNLGIDRDRVRITNPMWAVGLASRACRSPNISSLPPRPED